MHCAYFFLIFFINFNTFSTYLWNRKHLLNSHWFIKREVTVSTYLTAGHRYGKSETSF